MVALKNYGGNFSEYINVFPECVVNAALYILIWLVLEDPEDSVVSYLRLAVRIFSQNAQIVDYIRSCINFYSVKFLQVYVIVNFAVKIMLHYCIVQIKSGKLLRRRIDINYHFLRKPGAIEAESIVGHRFSMLVNVAYSSKQSLNSVI